MNRGRVGEERGGKETDRCPLTIFGLPIDLQVVVVKPVIPQDHTLLA
jgi:hypothetical protein